jgi:hypothetical protein
MRSRSASVELKTIASGSGRFDSRFGPDIESVTEIVREPAFMTTVDWAVMCDLAYFDGASRLCMFGIDTVGPVRTLSIGSHRLAIAIHFLDRDPHDGPDVALFVTRPNGEIRAADEVRDFCVESRGDYMLVEMPSMPLREEGLYRFELACGARQPTMCEVTVLVHAQRPARIPLHGAR